MVKKYSKTELEKFSNDYFSNNPEVEKVYCTTDGQIFKEENRADLHAKSEEKITVFSFQNPKSIEQENEDDGELSLKDTAATLLGVIQFVSDLDKLKSFLSQEQEGKKRKSVILALEARIAELEDPTGNKVVNDASVEGGINEGTSSEDTSKEEKGNEDESK